VAKVKNIRVLFLLVVTGLIAGHVQVIHAAEYGVINGATVTWAPQTNYSSVANYDQVIRIDDGAVDANGTHVIVPGIYVAVMPLGSPIPGVQQPGTSTIIVFETTSSGTPTSLVGSTSYYVYAAVGPQGSQFWTYVISAVPPWADGYPSQTVYYQMNFGGPPTGGGAPPQIYGESSTTSSLVYLGSFITLGNARIVGFSRIGEQVLLALPLGANGYYPSNIADPDFVKSVTPPPQANGRSTPPVNLPATFSSGIVPTTATALIADVSAPGSPEPGTSAGYIFLLNPQNYSISYTYPTSGTGCTASIVQPLLLSTTLQRVIAPIAQGTPTLNFGWCGGNPVGVSLTVVYQGYVEPTHHLTFVHP
jgi:hypothetical protein